MDPRWHDISNHDAGLCGMDVGLNRFVPKYFLLSGVFNNKTMTDTRAVINARLGERILVRLLNASYSKLRVTLECDALWAGCDGHGMGLSAWCEPVPIPAGTPLTLTPAQRYDLILTPPRAGTYLAQDRVPPLDHRQDPEQRRRASSRPRWSYHEADSDQGFGILCHLAAPPGATRQGDSVFGHAQPEPDALGGHFDFATLERPARH